MKNKNKNDVKKELDIDDIYSMGYAGDPYCEYISVVIIN